MHKGRNKTPEQLRAEVEAQQAKPSEPGNERTAEGKETPTPSRHEFFENLSKIARSKSA